MPRLLFTRETTVGQGVLWVMIQEYIHTYTDMYKTTKSGQENKHVEKREYEESVCCDQDGFGCMSLDVWLFLVSQRDHSLACR